MRPIVILGAGVLGRRIAAVFIAGGHTVHTYDPSSPSLSAASDYIKSEINTFTNITPSHPSPGHHATFTSLESAVQNAWLVVEAVPENLDLKIKTFADLDRFTPADCILVSNSSSFKSREMVAGLSGSRRKRVCNMHFTMPPEVRTVELMTDGETEEELFGILSDTLRECGMIPVTARKESTGFIFNRLWAAVKREILLILSQGVSDPAEIDLLWEHMFHSPQSEPPCRLMDKIGLDTVAFIEDNYINERGLDTASVDWLREQLISKGKLGLKSGEGLYPPSAPQDEEEGLYVLDVGLGTNVSTPVGTGRILHLNPATKKIKEVVTGQNLPDGIGISKSVNRIFWTNMGTSTATFDGALSSSAIDGSDIRVVLPAGAVHTPKQLVLDDEHHKIYFCDREGMSVHRCDYDGGNHETLVSRGDPTTDDKKDLTRWCVGITIDTVHGHLYWTQKGPSKAGKGRIFRAGLDIPTGSTAASRSDIEIVLDSLPEPIDLELDTQNQKLYWTDRGEVPLGCSLNRMDLKTRTKEILARQFHEPIGLKLDGDKVYVADLGGSVYRVDGKGKTVLHSDDGCYTGIA